MRSSARYFHLTVFDCEQIPRVSHYWLPYIYYKPPASTRGCKACKSTVYTTGPVLRNM